MKKLTNDEYLNLLRIIDQSKLDRLLKFNHIKELAYDEVEARYPQLGNEVWAFPESFQSVKDFSLGYLNCLCDCWSMVCFYRQAIANLIGKEFNEEKESKFFGYFYSDCLEKINNINKEEV